jgi:hypothetical protein
MTLVTYVAGDDQTVLFEIDPVPGFEPAGVDDVLGRVRDAIDPAITAAREVLERIKSLSPDGVDLKFGIKVSGQANWVVAKAATEGNFEVTLSWRPEPP